MMLFILRSFQKQRAQERTGPIVTMRPAVSVYDPIVQALAPCLSAAGCCTVIELVSRVLFMEY